MPTDNATAACDHGAHYRDGDFRVCVECGARFPHTPVCRVCEGALDYPDERADQLCRWCADPSYREVRSDGSDSLRDRIFVAIFDEAPTWEAQFHGHSGHVVGVPDAATVAARACRRWLAPQTVVVCDDGSWCAHATDREHGERLRAIFDEACGHSHRVEIWTRMDADDALRDASQRTPHSSGGVP